MRIRQISSTFGAIALSALVGCATSPRPDNGYGYIAQPEPARTYSRPTGYAERGVVRAIEVVPVSTRPSGAGAVLGAIVGGVVGNQFGSGSGRAATTIGGAAAGALAGNAVEKRTRREDEVYRVSVQFEDGSIRDYDYQQIGDLRVGDPVALVDGQLHYVE
jgi:outer membrane lipoprotein SlyB